MKEDQFMQLAIDLATHNVESGKGGPFGAIIVKDGAIISKACNSVTSTNDPTAHAEVNAIREACNKLHTFDLAGCELYTSCEPCPMCLAAIYWARIDKVYVSANQHDAAEAGFDDAFLYTEFALPKEKRSIQPITLLAKLGKAPFKAWIAKENKIPY